MLETDVVVIGAGVVGAGIAREISRWDLGCVLVEKQSDVAEGTSKANNGIVHAGYAAACGTTKARLNVKGSMMYEAWTAELDVPYKRIGSIVVALNDDELPALREELDNGRKNGVPGLEIIAAERLREMEPNINPEAVAGLYAPSGAITCPYEFTIALAENAAANGVKVMLEAEVIDIKRVDAQRLDATEAVEPQSDAGLRGVQKANLTAGGRSKGPAWDVVTTRGTIRTKIVVNAAGLFSDRIAAMIGDTSFSIRPRKGEYYLLDKSVQGLVNHVLFPVGSAVSKGITVMPTVDGNTLLGPTADYVDDKNDLGTTAQGLASVLAGARRLVPKVPIGKTIAQYAGLRATIATEDFLIGESAAGPGFVNVAGIQSPGLASAPAIAVEVASMVISLLEERGIKARPREGFSPYRRRVPRFRELSMEERDRLIAADPDWGTVVCRCETVTRKEVIDAIHRPLGARTVDAVKRRTRAGMGRCQGGFCTPRIAAILAEELGIPETEVTKFGGGSRLLVGRVKDHEDA